MIIRWNDTPPKAWYILLTDNGKLLLSFFCQIVEDVIAIKAIIVATKPATGMFEPISKPRTKVAPENPSNTPIHCLKVTFSFNIGPLKAFVKIGWRVTIKAAIPVGIPFEIEKKTPPKESPWNKTPLKKDSIKFFLFIKILCLVNRQNKQKPIATNKNLKARAENGSLLSIIGLVVINADDHNKTKINGKTLIIKAL